MTISGWGRGVVRITLAALVALAVGKAASAQISSCIGSCYEKRFNMALDVNSNGLPDPGDIVRYEVTFCNSRPPMPGQQLTCTVTDAVDGLNDPGDLTLVEDPLNPGDPGQCFANDDGQTSCTSANVVTIADCNIDVMNDQIQVTTTHTGADGCFTFYFFGQIDAGISGMKDICNQAVGSGQSDDPNTGATDDPTCFTIDAPPPAPTITKEIPGCPAPCTVGISSFPGSTTVRYEVTIANNDPDVNLDGTFRDDVPAGALGFNIINKGDGTGCGVGGPPFCANVPAPGGANGTGEIVITDLSMSRSGGLGASRTIVFEIEYACPPLNDGADVSNQGRFVSTSDSRCNPCVSDDPGTVPVDDPTNFTTSCQPPPVLTVDKTVNVATWSPGESTTLSYTITLCNTSTTANVRGIQVIDDLPDFPSDLPAFDQAATCPGFQVFQDGNPMTCNTGGCSAASDPGFDCGILEILPGVCTTLTFDVVILDTLADQFQLCNEVDTTIQLQPGPGDDACTTITLPQTVDFRDSTKAVSPDPASPGQEITYTLTIENTGTGTATNVVVTDDLPACLDTSTFDAGDVTTSRGTDSVSGNTVTVDIGSMASGEIVTITIRGIFATGAASCCNQADIISTELFNPQQTRAPGGNPGDQTCFVPPAAVDFRDSTKAVAPSPMTTGQPLTYTLTIENSGTGTANNVVVTDILPGCVTVAGLTPADVTVSPAAGAVVGIAGNTVTVNITSMPAAQIRTITINPLLTSRLVAGAETANCCNQATVVSDQVPSPGHRTGTTPGDGLPTCAPIQAGALTVDFRQSTKGVSPNPMVTGQPITYTLTITNSGGSPTTNVVVTDILPGAGTPEDCLDASQLTAADVTVNPAGGTTVNVVGGVVTVTIASMAASETRTITIGPTNLLAGALDADCCNQATIRSDQVPAPGHRTGETPGSQQPSCYAIVPPGGTTCDLAENLIATRADIPAAYTRDCSPADPRLNGPVTLVDVQSGDFIGPPTGAGGSLLTLDQWTCACSQRIALTKDLTQTPDQTILTFF